jgi:hypothetical protein
MRCGTKNAKTISGGAEIRTDVSIRAMGRALLYHVQSDPPETGSTIELGSPAFRPRVVFSGKCIYHSAQNRASDLNRPTYHPAEEIQQ